MSKSKPLPLLERLHEMFDLDRIEGKIFWKIGRRAGKEAGTINGMGYCVVGIHGSYYKVHRIIWEMINGSELREEEEIDHIDGNHGNNQPNNLRLATHFQNQQNSKAKRNGPYPKGVYRVKNTFSYSATIYANNKRVHLGTFDTPKKAHAAYAKASRELHGEFGRTA